MRKYTVHKRRWHKRDGTKFIWFFNYRKHLCNAPDLWTLYVGWISIHCKEK